MSSSGSDDTDDSPSETSTQSGSTLHPYRDLPNQLLNRKNTNPIRDRKYVTRGEAQLVWDTRWTHEGKKHAVLNWLASNCSAPGAKHLKYAQRYKVFTEDATRNRPDVCITLRHGTYIYPRKRGGGYIRVVLGSRDADSGRKKRKLWHEVAIDAHRLVCWLTRGGPPDRERSYVLHDPCHNPACVKPGHLQWNSQSVNVQQGITRSGEKKAADKARRQGAPSQLLHPAILCEFLLCMEFHGFHDQSSAA